MSLQAACRRAGLRCHSYVCVCMPLSCLCFCFKPASTNQLARQQPSGSATSPNTSTSGLLLVLERDQFIESYKCEFDDQAAHSADRYEVQVSGGSLLYCRSKAGSDGEAKIEKATQQLLDNVLSLHPY